MMRWAADLLLLGAACITSVSAVCQWMKVSGTGHNGTANIDGDYGLVHGTYCSGHNLWVAPTYYGHHVYIYYSIQISIPGSTKTAGWAIVPDTNICPVKYPPYATQLEYYYSRPQDVPKGHWQARQTESGRYISSPHLKVTCNTYLTTGAIVGITIGCICGVLLLAAGAYAIYAAFKAKKRQPTPPTQETLSQTQQTERTTATAYTASHGGYYYYPGPAAASYGGAAYPSDSGHYDTSIPGLPAYHEPPPSYEGHHNKIAEDSSV